MDGRAGLIGLTKALLKARRGLASGAVGILGLVLAFVAFSPIIVFSWRLMTK